MKTVITEQIDGYTVVMGFGDLLIDAVATRAKVDDVVRDDPDTLEAARIIGKMAEVHNEINKSTKRRFTLSARIWQKGKADGLKEQFDLMAIQVRDLKKKIDEKRWNLFQSNPIYFTPKLGETAIEDNRLISKFPPPKGSVLLANGSLIPDNRYTEYWIKGKKWVHRTIEKLGETAPFGAILSDALPIDAQVEIREQFDIERIAALSFDDKILEKIQALQMALGRSAAIRSEKEILGEPDALKQAKAWYDIELERIEQRYK